MLSTAKHLCAWHDRFFAVEITFYISALSSNPTVMGLISLDLIYAVQHLYFTVAAPALFLPLGAVLLGSRVLPRGSGTWHWCWELPLPS